MSSEQKSETKSTELSYLMERFTRCADLPTGIDVPVVTISPTHSCRLPHTDSYPCLRQSPSNVSIEGGLTASPIPWRDASMEVLVSPNDCPLISIEDFDDTPYVSEAETDYDTASMCEMNANRTQGKPNLDDPTDSQVNGVDKVMNRKFACYGISPRLARKTNDFLTCNFIPVDKGSRPKTLSFSPPLKSDNQIANTEEDAAK